MSESLANARAPIVTDVEAVRRGLLEGIRIPAELVNRALNVVADKLDAKETKFFSFKGRVVTERQVDAHGIQLQATDQILSLAGLYARERIEAPEAPRIAMEIDSRTGVMRIIVGQTVPLAPSLSKVIEAAPVAELLAEVEATTESTPAAPAVVAHDATRRRPMPIPDSVMRIIHDEVVE